MNYGGIFLHDRIKNPLILLFSIEISIKILSRSTDSIGGISGYI